MPIDCAFSGCTDLQYNEYNNAYYWGNSDNLYLWLIKAKADNITTCSINERTKFIYRNAFYNCSGLTSVTIPDSVKSIGEKAFYNCSGLTSVTIGNGVTSIGEKAFSGCNSLEEITIPFIGSSSDKQYPFGKIFGTSRYEGGTQTSQVIYTNTGSSHTYYFYIPSTLKKVTVTGGNIHSGAFRNCSGLTSITIPDGVTSIGNGAFSGCSSLTSITIPDGVTSIGSGAFSGCGSLTSIVIPDSVTSIGNQGTQAFYGCPIETATIPAFACSAVKNNNLKTVVITSGESIGGSAFSGCSSLTSIVIPDSVTSIGYQAFYNCSRLTSVYYLGTEEKWNRISIGDYNSKLTSATRYYYSENNPFEGENAVESGNYWHYDTDGKTILVWSKE